MKPKLPANFPFPGVLLLAGVPFIIASGLASATTYTWDGGGGDNNWQTPGNWNPDVAPAAGTTSDLIFAGSTRLTASNDFTALSDFGSLSFGSGAGAFVLGGNSITLNGNITNSSSNLQTITLATALASGPHTVTTNASGDVTISGAVSGGGGLLKAGAGTLTLSGGNSFTGGTTISAGTLKIGNATALGGNAGAASVTSGAVLDLNGTTMTGTNALTLNGTGINSGGALTNSSATAGTYAGLVTLGSASSIIAGTGNITLSNTGAITGSGFGLTVGGANNTTIASIIGTGAGTLTKQDAGTLTLSAANTLTGSTTINGGTLSLSTAGASLASSAVTANSTVIFTVGNSSAAGSAVTRSNGLTLNGGKLAVTGSSSQNTTDTFGVLTLGQGAGVSSGGSASASVLSGGNNVILVSPNAAKNTRLNFTSATVNAGGTVLFSANGSSVIGANTLASATAGGINIAFTGTAPALIGAAVSGGTITTTSGIIPWAVTNTAGGTSLTDFVTYDSAYGVRTLTTYGSTLALSGGVAQNVKLTTADATNNTNGTVNSLIVGNSGANITQNISGILTVNSGALLLNPGFGFATTIAGGTLQLGTGGADGFIYMQQGRLNTISSVISGPDASHNLVLDFGNANNSGGVQVLGGNNSYAGGTIVNNSNANSSLVIGGTSTLGLGLTAGTTGSFGAGNVTLNNIKVLLNHSNAFTLANNISGSGTSVIQQSATGTATLSGNISGTVGVTQSTASSTLMLSGTNTHTGVTNLSGGTLQFNGAASMSGGSALALAAGTTLNLRSDTSASFSPAAITASNVGTYNIDVGNLSSGTGQTLTLAGAMGFGNGSQQINVTSGSTGYTLGLGAITHNTTANGSAFTINATTAAATVSSFTFGSYGSNLTLQGGNNVSVGGLIFSSNGTETITVAGANATFTGTNTWINNRNSGAYSVVLNSGSLNMNTASFMTNAFSGGHNGSSLTLNGGTLDNTSGAAIQQNNNGIITVGGDFTFGGSNALNLGTGAVTLTASRTITTNGSALLTLGGAVSGSGFTLTKAGSGSLKLNGVIGTGSGGVTVNDGTLTLAGINTYSGGTNVTNGRLNITGSIASATAVSAGATLGGDGTITGNVSLGGTLAPGQGGVTDRTLNINGNVTTSAGSALSFTVTSLSNYDKLVIGSGSSIGLNNTDLVVDFNNSIDFTELGAGLGDDFLAQLDSFAGEGSWFKLITGTTTGMFHNVTQTMDAAELSYYGLGGTQYKATIDGQDFWVVQGSTYLVAVPEPSATWLGVMGASCLLLLRRRRDAPPSRVLAFPTDSVSGKSRP